MNDAEMTRLLRVLDDEVPLDAARAAGIRSAMLTELDRETGDRVVDVVAELPARGLPRRRWVPLAVAAAVVVLIIGLVFAPRSDDGLAPADTSPPVATEPEVVNYLRTCVDFQTATSRGDANWFEVLSELERQGSDDLAYRSELADALDVVAEAPRAVGFADAIRGAADAARTGEPVGDLIARLRLIEQQSLLAAGLECLS